MTRSLCTSPRESERESTSRGAVKRYEHARVCAEHTAAVGATRSALGLAPESIAKGIAQILTNATQNGGFM